MEDMNTAQKRWREKRGQNMNFLRTCSAVEPRRGGRKKRLTRPSKIYGAFSKRGARIKRNCAVNVGTVKIIESKHGKHKPEGDSLKGAVAAFVRGECRPAKNGKSENRGVCLFKWR